MFVVSINIDGECKKPLVPLTLNGFSRTKREPATLPEMKELTFMKFALFLLGIVSVLSLVGCVSTPVAVAPVGPNPYGRKSMVSEGELVVFSRLHACTEGDNPTWYQHSDYRIYNFQGKLVKYVGNSIGEYEQAPLPVTLPPGRYIVRSRARDYLRVEVPVIIKPGQTTNVHLDDNWRSPTDSQESELVILPNGNPVGWRAGNQKGGSGSS
jgi:hypothetical protein